MYLDGGRAQLDCRLDLRRRRADEQRDPDTRVLERVYHGPQLRLVLDRIEAALGGPLGALLRHKADRVWPGLERNGHHLVGRRHLEVERLVDLGLQPRDIVVADVWAGLAPRA